MTDKEKYILEHYLILKNGEVFSNLKTKNWFLGRNKKPNKGKLYNAIIKYTNEDVTTIERNLNTAIEV